MSTSGQPESRRKFTIGWTGAELLIAWGGDTDPLNNEPYEDGAAYSLSTDSWLRFTPSLGGGESTGEWCAGRLVQVHQGTAPNVYDPVGDVSQIGRVAGVAYRSGAATVDCYLDRYLVTYGTSEAEKAPLLQIYDIDLDSWQLVPASGAQPRRFHGAVIADDALVIWGGKTPDDDIIGSGEVIDLTTGAVSPLSDLDAPVPRINPRMHWTGTEVLLWGGSERWDGHRYSIAEQRWAPIPPHKPAPESKFRGVSLWLGDELFLYQENWAGRYNPTTDSWTDVGKGPSVYYGKAVWTGEQVLFWEASGGGIWIPPN